MNVIIKHLDPEAITPTYATRGSAGVDLMSVHDRTVEPGEISMIHTGIAIEIPIGFEGQIRPRSGLASRFYGFDIPNSPGTIDSDYRGEVCVLVRNLSENNIEIGRGDKVAQLVITPVMQVHFKKGELSLSERNEGGFGSTGR